MGLDGTDVGEGDSGFDVLTSRPVATDQCIGVENGVPKDKSGSVSSRETQSIRVMNREEIEGIATFSAPRLTRGDRERHTQN